MRTRSTGLALLLCAVIGPGCAAAKLTRPLEKGGHEVHASLGGPLIKFGGAPVPVPFMQLGYRYGLSENLAAGVDLPVTLALLKNVAVDPNLTWFPTGRLGIQAESVLVLDLDKRVFRAYPVLSTWYTIPVSGKFSLLPGLAAMSQAKSPRLLVAPSVAGAFELGRWDLQLEVMYMAPNVKNNYSAVDYVSPGRGALGLYFAVGKRLK